MVLRSVLGGVFTAMALGQAVSFAQMPEILSAYGLVSGAGATVPAVSLTAGELVCGVWFLARPRSRAIAPVWVYTAVSVVWAGLAVQAYARAVVVSNCGRFGRYLSQSLGWFVLLQDGLLLVYAAVLLRGARSAAASDPADTSGRSAPSRTSGPRRRHRSAR